MGHYCHSYEIISQQTSLNSLIFVTIFSMKFSLFLILSFSSLALADLRIFQSILKVTILFLLNLNIKGFICRQEMAQLPQGLFSLPSTGQDSYIAFELINCQSNISMITDHQPNLSTIGVQNKTYQQLVNFTRYRTFYHAAKSGLKVSVERGNFFIELCRKKF